jgi:hypothetical protein
VTPVLDTPDFAEMSANVSRETREQNLIEHQVLTAGDFLYPSFLQFFIIFCTFCSFSITVRVINSYELLLRKTKLHSKKSLRNIKKSEF